MHDKLDGNLIFSIDDPEKAYFSILLTFELFENSIFDVIWH